MAELGVVRSTEKANDRARQNSSESAALPTNAPRNTQYTGYRVWLSMGSFLQEIWRHRHAGNSRIQ